MASSAPEDLVASLTELVREATTRYLTEVGLVIALEDLPIDLRFSTQPSFGDYSMPIMGWASKQKLGRPALVIAEALGQLLHAAQHPTIAEITVTPPGFLNFRLNRPTIGHAIIARVLEAGPNYGQNTVGTGTKVIVEHTAINSNKAAHVGHLRNACIGDTVVRMLRSQGYTVEAQNYIDDSGVQVADVLVGFQLLQQGQLQVSGGNQPQPGEPFDYFCSRVYVAVGHHYEAHPERLELRHRVLHTIEHGAASEGDPDYATIAADLSRQIVAAHLKTMARLNICYDLLTWESAILRAGLWAHTFEMLRERGLLVQPQTGLAAGCWLLPFDEALGADGTEQERREDKILVRSDGTATYTAKDIANQLWKFGLADDPAIGVQFAYVPWGTQRNGHLLWSMRVPTDVTASGQEIAPPQFGHAHRVINVIDVRQAYPQQVVYESLRRLGYVEQADDSIHLAYGMVTLSATTAANLGVDVSSGREFYAMSGRKGLEIKADDLINAAVARLQAVESTHQTSDETAAILASSAIRYFLIRLGLQQTIVLDIDEVLRPTGETGVYLHYAYARARGILRRLEERGYAAPEQWEGLPEHLDQSEWELLRQIEAYPRRLAEATTQLAPNLLAAYAFDLAAHFSAFFEHTAPIVHEPDQRVKAFRTYLVAAAAQTLGNVLGTLGFVPLATI